MLNPSPKHADQHSPSPKSCSNMLIETTYLA